MTSSKPTLIRDSALKAHIHDKLRAFSVQTASPLQNTEQPHAAAALAFAIIDEGYGAAHRQQLDCSAYRCHPFPVP